MKDTILDTLTAARDIAYRQDGFNAPATKALDEAIEERRLEVAAIRVALAEAIHVLNEYREQFGCATPVAVTEAITGLIELQKRYRT